MTLGIGELARRSGVQVVTIRWWEAQGVISPVERTPGGFRLFDEAALQRLLFVRRARDAGLTLEEVRDLLELASTDAGAPGVGVEAERRLRATDRRAADLAALRSVLEGLARGDGAVAPGDIVAALAREGD